MDLRKLKRRRRGALFGLDILEFRQVLEIAPQMRVVERPLETAPPERLRLLLAPERLHHLNPHLLPFERYPAGSPLFDGIDCAPSLFGASSFQ